MSKTKCLLNCYNQDLNNYEIGSDEVGRGCLFGAVYASAVILPKKLGFSKGLTVRSVFIFSKKCEGILFKVML